MVHYFAPVLTIPFAFLFPHGGPLYRCTDGHLGFPSLPFTNDVAMDSLIWGEIPEAGLLH